MQETISELISRQQSEKTRDFLRMLLFCNLIISSWRKSLSVSHQPTGQYESLNFEQQKWSFDKLNKEQAEQAWKFFCSIWQTRQFKFYLLITHWETNCPNRANFSCIMIKHTCGGDRIDNNITDVRNYRTMRPERITKTGKTTSNESWFVIQLTLKPLICAKNNKTPISHNAKSA